MTDQPIAHTKDGRPLFDNTPTVVVMLVKRGGDLLLIRRANQPGFGKIALPGGYHMRGEVWQMAGAREVAEETGYVLERPDLIRQVGEVVTDEYGNNLVIALYDSGPMRHDPDVKQPGETLEVMWTPWFGSAEDWAFPRHYAAAKTELES
ncbi:MAG: NUDIX domain-containing protein [Mesorhizobium sp.]|nr:MAG: NUDIX domain-containing protein [Mesorhizobium sp.]